MKDFEYKEALRKNLERWAALVEERFAREGKEVTVIGGVVFSDYTVFHLDNGESIPLVLSDYNYYLALERLRNAAPPV